MSGSIDVKSGSSQESGTLGISPKKRIPWIDACKGIGISFVVLGHLVRGYMKADVFSGYLSVMGRIFYIVYGFHMPLLFILSGYTFHMAYCRERDGGHARYHKQIMNFIWIFSLFSILLWGMKWVAASWFHLNVNDVYAMHDLLWEWIFPKTLYWYLWDLVLYYIIFYTVLEKMHCSMKLVFPITIALSLFGSLLPLSNDQTPRNLLYFSLPFSIGICADMYDWIEKITKKVMMPIGCMALGGIAYVIISGKSLLENNKWYINTGGGYIAGLCIAVSVIYLCVHLAPMKESKILNYCGRHSLEIYVLHPFVQLITREGLLMVGITNFYFNVMMNWFMTIGICLFAADFLRRVHLYQFFFKPSAIWMKEI